MSYKGIWIPLDIVQNETLQPIDKILAGYIGFTGNCNAKNKCLVKQFGTSERTISRAILRLQSENLIQVWTEGNTRIMCLRQNDEDSQFDGTRLDKMAREGSQNGVPYNTSYNRNKTQTHLDTSFEKLEAEAKSDFKLPSFEECCAEFSEEDRDSFDLKWYYEKVKNWARNQDKPLRDFTAMVKIFIQNDVRDEKLKTKNNNKNGSSNTTKRAASKQGSSILKRETFNATIDELMREHSEDAWN